MKKENAENPTLSLGANFEVIEESPAAASTKGAASAPSPTAGRTPGVQAVAGASPFDPPFGPIRSSNAWASMGLVIAAGGLLGPWTTEGGNFFHGFLLAYTIWFLIRGGFLAVQRTGQTIPVVLPALLVVYGALRIAMGSGLEALAWGPAEGMLDNSGALLTLVGGLVALLMPKVAGKKDAKLPPPGNPLQLDKQFSLSLLAYLMIFVGMQMQWTDEAKGSDSLMGVISLLLAMVMIWASWVSMWQLWQKPLVMGKLGLLLFLAPLECFSMGVIGMVRLSSLPAEDGLINGAYPGSQDLPFLQFSGGPLLVLVASCFALYLIGSGAKEAVAITKQKKADQVASRKAARSSRKPDSKGSEKTPASSAKKESAEKK